MMSFLSKRHFAERTFGIKAKLDGVAHGVDSDFAERTFGIKAKHGSLSHEK